MRCIELCTLTESQIDDLLGLMKELNAEQTVTAQMQRRAVTSPGTRIFIAENDQKHIVGCATLFVFELPTGRKASECRGCRGLIGLSGPGNRSYPPAPARNECV